MTKILLVEDDKSLREIYGVRLMAEGYEIVSAGDGEEALAMAIKERPSLILSDVMMPKISGFDMLDILRSTTETKDIKVIMMTALSSDDQRARGEALGADRYLVKSQVGIEDVVRTVHDVLGDSIAKPAPAPSFPSSAPMPPLTEPAPAPVAQPTPEPVAAPQNIPTISLAPEPAPAPVAPIAPAPPEPVAFAMPVPTPPPAPQPFNAPEVPVQAPAPTAPVEPVFVAPTPAPVYAAPAPEPAFTPQPVAAPAPAPVAPPAPVPVTPTPAPTTLPEPTAPFSTDRPASLGDRVINPLPSAADVNMVNNSLADQINQELNGPNTPPTA